MDREPKTRQETKGKKGKEGKGVYNQKAVRIQEAMMEKNKHKNNNKNNNKNIDIQKKK